MTRGKARTTLIALLAAAGVVTVIGLAPAAEMGAAAAPAPTPTKTSMGVSPVPVCTSTLHKDLARRIARDIKAAISSRSRSDYDAFRHVSVAVRDNYVTLNCWYHMRQSYYSASAVKATILAALLREVQEQHRGLTTWEKSNAWRMITRSDNNAATALWKHVGLTRLQHFLDLAGMHETTLNTWGAWGLTGITAFDETLLLRLLQYHNKVLTDHSRNYQLDLMSHVISSQAWGVRAGVPTWFSWHIKNGWAPLPNLATSPWVVNSIGCFLYKQRGYTIVILTDHNPGSGPNYGIATIETIARVINHDINPGARSVWPTSAPQPSWQIPDEQVPARPSHAGGAPR
jgi:beta-lactamase class A